jgi:hypothetical protein
MVRMEESGCRRWVEGGIISASELRTRSTYAYAGVRAHGCIYMCTRARAYTHTHTHTHTERDGEGRRRGDDSEN